MIQDLGFSAQGGSASGGKIQELSIGHYVLTGGELPAMVLIDAISRRLPGVLGKEESLEERRLGVGVPVYTRPEVFSRSFSDRGKKEEKVSRSQNFTFRQSSENKSMAN